MAAVTAQRFDAHGHQGADTGAAGVPSPAALNPVGPDPVGADLASLDPVSLDPVSLDPRAPARASPAPESPPQGPRPKSDVPRSNDAVARGLILPPEPSSGSPVVREASFEPYRKEAPSSPGPSQVSALFLANSSFFPDHARDTDLPRSTEVGEEPVHLAERDRALLLRMDGTEAGEVQSLEKDSLQIGRHPTTDIPVNDHGVSRVHARVYRLNGVHFVEDLGSRNGTFVQGRRVEHAVLEDGDTLQIGPRVLFRYSLVDRRQEQLLRQLYESSKRDALTGVYNRQHFEERVAAELSYAHRHRTPLSLVMFDLDHFKKVNDTYGHQAGDAVLRHVAAIVTQRLRTEDVFARIGGEEFVVVLRGIDVRAAARVGERMRVAVATKPAHFEGLQIPVSISVGCASATCCKEPTSEALVEVADRRLYAAKHGGRNRVVSTG
jgi:diguanylate cyclase (GGDEF)-like protein